MIDGDCFRKKHSWDDPTVTSINRAPDHTRWGAYEDAEQAVQRVASPWIHPLDGMYAFKLYETPNEADGFYLPDFDENGFSQVQVPGCWETQGFGKPLYTNVPYPWPLSDGGRGALRADTERLVYDPPLPPAENLTGCYRRYFEAPNCSGRETFLRFEGVEAAFHVWINGEPVGYSEDSKLPCEFDITEFLRPGQNLLAVRVVRFASSSWLEDQDYWSLSGIFRSVCLVLKPRLRIQDYRITASHDGCFTAETAISRVSGFALCRVRVVLYSPDGRIAAQSEDTVAAENAFSLRDGPMSSHARTCFHVSDAVAWSPDNPVLYTAVFTLLSPDGEAVDFESCRVGFKSVEVRGGVVLLNGKRLIVRGINRHEHCLEGRTVTEKHMREEIRQMKRMNINAVRTSHYPDSPVWYDLCDELGLLCVSECNIETHGLGGLLSNDPSWAAAYLERAFRMARMYKNHVCIFAWSLGNESGYGPNQAAMYGYLKEYDATRLCQYESAQPGPNISDVRGRMYATERDIFQYLSDPDDTRPIILIEWLYQISNSGGGAYLFRKLTSEYARFQGGFVWDWQDKALWAGAADSGRFYGYGGDFSESICNSTPFMTCNGVVLPDLSWKPSAYELKAVYAPIYIERRDGVGTWNTKADDTRYALVNSSFTDSSEAFACTVILKENGVEIARRPFDLPATLPGETREFSVSVPHEKKPCCEYHLDFELCRKIPAWYEDTGDLVFAAQFSLPKGKAGPRTHDYSVITDVCRKGNLLRVETKEFTADFDMGSGLLDGLFKHGRRLIWGGEPSFARPYTGLDCQEGWGWFEETASLVDTKTALTDCRDLCSGKELVVTSDFFLSAMYPVKTRVTYRVCGEGLVVELYAEVDDGWRVLPRAGLCFFVGEGLESLRYCGYGPVECYPDRHEAARLGVYETTVTAQHFPFIPPSETGGHEGARWLTLTDDTCCGIQVAGTPFHFDARHSTVSDYRLARHDHELVRRSETILHLDAAHSPIGSHMAWSTDIDPRAMLSGGVYAHRFYISLIP